MSGPRRGHHPCRGRLVSGRHGRTARPDGSRCGLTPHRALSAPGRRGYYPLDYRLPGPELRIYELGGARCRRHAQTCIPIPSIS